MSAEILKSRPRLHTAPRKAPLTSRSKWLQDVTGLREGEQREPPPLSPQEKLEELKHKVFVNRYNDEMGTMSKLNKQCTEATVDARAAKKKNIDPDTKKSTKKIIDQTDVRPRSATREEKENHLRNKISVTKDNPKPLVATTKAPHETIFSEVLPPQQQRWLDEARKSIKEAKTTETCSQVIAELSSVATTQKEPVVGALDAPEIKTGENKNKKGVSWLRKALNTFDIGNRKTTTAKPTIPYNPPPKYTKTTSPLQQQLWLTEIKKAMVEVKVAEELYSNAFGGTASPSAQRVSFVEGREEADKYPEAEAELPRPRHPDYYAGNQSESEGIGVEDDDDDDSVSSIQVLLNWCLGETPIAPRRLNTRETLVAATE